MRPVGQAGASGAGGAALASPTLIQPIDGAVLLAARGVWREVALAAYKGQLLARLGAGYIRLHESGSTSNTATRWVGMRTEYILESNPLGYLTLKEETTDAREPT